MKDKQNEITVRAGRTTQPQDLVPPSPRKTHEQQAVCGSTRGACCNKKTVSVDYRGAQDILDHLKCGRPITTREDGASAWPAQLAPEVTAEHIPQSSALLTAGRG